MIIFLYLNIISVYFFYKWNDIYRYRELLTYSDYIKLAGTM